ncbi:MAG: hypothetical protein AAF604_04805 [Acidobacteriota bacterium]
MTGVDELHRRIGVAALDWHRRRQQVPLRNRCLRRYAGAPHQTCQDIVAYKSGFCSPCARRAEYQHEACLARRRLSYAIKRFEASA